MGDVYRAKDLRLGREVAVKLLPESVASSPDRVARLEREARTVAGLNHPNIVTLHSIEEEDGVRFLTMELVGGQTLATLMTPGGLPFSRILDLSTPLAEALTAAHERGVVHRDLKPGNVMVTREGRVKVLDFGLAKILGGDTPGEDMTAETVVDPSLSSTGQVFGTVPYMAPEQIRGEAVDARTDLFALGIVLYELSTGQRPFAGRTAAMISSAILRDDPMPLQGIRPDLPGEFGRLVSRCLEKNPRDRAQAALDVYNELRRLKETLDRGAQMQAGSSNVPSVAVLPFVNRSRDEADEYFSDGLADELLNMLAKIRGLHVAARASAFQFKGKNEDIAMIGQKLKVATVLDGSVRKSGNRVRISVQLVKVSDGYHLWSETYDRTLDDIFAVQDDIAQTVVKELRTTLLGKDADSGASGRAKAEVANAAKGRGQNVEAHRLHLQGRHLVERITREDVSRGIEYLKEALQVDPKNARAWAELSRAQIIQAGYGWVPMAEGFEAAQETVKRALTIEPDLPEGYLMLGRIQLYFQWDWSGADASYRRAQELAPGNAVGRHGAGVLLENQGRINEAIELYRLAVEQDPLSAGGYDRLGTVFQSANRLAESEEAYRKAIELAPQRVRTRSSLALTLLAQRRAGEALEEAAREPELIYHLLALVVVHHAMGHASESDESLRTLVEKYTVGGAAQIAQAYAWRGEPDAAFDWLARAYEQRDPGLAEVKQGLLYRPLHDDPRWGGFLMKMGLEA
jgi:serine/threonine protein kinase/cytochrome c-type biogenesis protein CcmH/NrfG